MRSIGLGPCQNLSRYGRESGALQIERAPLEREVAEIERKLEANLAEAIRRSDRLIDEVADGVLSGAAIKDSLAALETQRATLEAELAAEEACPCPCILVR